MAGQASIEGGEGKKGPLQKAALARPHSSRPAPPRPTCAKEARQKLSWTTSTRAAMMQGWPKSGTPNRRRCSLLLRCQPDRGGVGCGELAPNTQTLSPSPGLPDAGASRRPGLNKQVLSNRAYGGRLIT